MKLEGLKIDFLGDSITEGCGTSGPDCRFSALLQRSCELAEARNYGISGTRYARQRVPSEEPLTDRDFCERAGEMDRDADVVFVFGGTNDFGHGDAPFGRIGDKDPATFCGAYDALIEYLMATYGKEKLIIVYPLRRRNETATNGDGSKADGSKPLAEYHDAEKVVAEKCGLKSVDFWNDGDLNPNTPDGNENFADGLHPNDIGHRLLGEKLAEAIKRM